MRLFRFDEEKIGFKDAAKACAVFNLSSSILASKIELGISSSDLIIEIINKLGEFDKELKNNISKELGPKEKPLKITSHTL